MKLKEALSTARQAMRANLFPGLLLQAFMALFLVLYFFHQGTREFLAQVAHLKQVSGYAFAFVSYAISAALLPEVLRVVFFQKGRVTRLNWWNAATAVPFWGLDGMLVDLLYRCQVLWFGAGSGWETIVLKMAVDQFVFSLFLNVPATTLYFAWRDQGFRWDVLGKLVRPKALFERVFPVQVAGWCIWIPGVCVIYFMPSELQLPVAVLIQIFWVLVLTLINTDRPRDKAVEEAMRLRE